MKINLGCGTDLRPGWINVDALSDVGADVVANISQPLPFVTSSAEQIAAQDVIEHLTRPQQEQLLQEIARILRPGGKLSIRVPNIDDIVNRFAADIETRNLFLFGDTSVQGEWGAHKWVPTLRQLQAVAKLHHLRMTNWQSVNTNYELEFVKSSRHLITVNSLLFVNQSLGLGGAEVFNSQLLTWLSKAGVRITSYVTHPQFAKQLAHSHRIPLVVDVIGDWKGLIKGLLLLPLAVIYYGWLTWTQRHVDVIFMTGFIEKILITPWARLLKVAVVWEEFGPLQPVTGKFFGFPQLLYRIVKSLPDIIIVPSLNTRNLLVLQNQVSPAKLTIIPCARNKPERANLPVSKSLVVCVSRLEKGKGQEALVSAWPQVVAKIPQAKLRLVGEGERAASLQSLVSRLNLDESVVITGWVADSVAEMARAQVCICPSMWPLEGFGLVAVEAMSLAKPVVGFNLRPISEIVDSRCGILVAPGDTTALAAAIIKLLTHPNLAKKLGQKGREKYLQQYTFDQVGPQILHQLKLAKAYVKRD
ncbi:MAG: glycosyltransferase [bacterium]|nr:glycosyltransferase [bacterium]